MKNELMPYEEAAILSWSRKERFNDGFCCFSTLKELLQTFFNSGLEDSGLNSRYNMLKTYVENTSLIGLILWGKYRFRYPYLQKKKYSNLIYNYTNINNIEIPLTIQSICIHLIDDYFRKEEIVKLCRETPNYHIYIKPALENFNNKC